MKVRVQGPQHLGGHVRPPGSKAYTHRALIASLLTKGRTVIKEPLVSDDTAHTLDAIQELGARVHERRNEIEINGTGEPSHPDSSVDCGESGATLRFLTAVASTSFEKITLTTKTGLAKRPIAPLLQALTKLGAEVSLHQVDDALRITVQGPLRGGGTTIEGEVTSQFISGLLLASPRARNNVTIRVEGRLESRPYVDLTLAVLKQHGVTVEETEGTFLVPAPQEYRPTIHEVPRDFSSAAFLFALGSTVGDPITLSGFETNYQLEPDSIIVKLLPEIGVKLETSGEHWTVSKSQLQSFNFDASDHPDLVPVLAILGAQANGTTTISGVKRLRYKETDRLLTVPSELAKMGARIDSTEDSINIHGIEHLTGKQVSSHHDHRIAMACTIAALAAKGKSVIDDAGVVSKSYPAFYNDLQTLGAAFDVE